VGYAGGIEKNPNYNHIGGHTETVQVDYDPERITYGKLLDIFWNSHRPVRQSGSRQYMNVIFYHNEEQRRQAMASKAELEEKIGRIIKTEVRPLGTFTLAEDYHQKYILKQHPLKKEMTRIYPFHPDFVNSTAVTRLNGYAGGYGDSEQLSREIEILGLSDEGKKILTGIVRR
jgi:methionine-S-sulfoxide reductase